jgi:hypothetical protein
MMTDSQKPIARPMALPIKTDLPSAPFMVVSSGRLLSQSVIQSGGIRAQRVTSEPMESNVDWMPLDQSNILRLHLEGPQNLGGDVQLGVFIDKLSAFRAALSETDHLLSPGGGRCVDFKVRELRHESPAMIGVVAYPRVSASPIQCVEVVREFSRFLHGIRAGTLRAEPRCYKLVSELRRLTAGVGARFARAWIDGPHFDAVPLDEQTERALVSALPPIRKELGEVKGVVKRYSGVNKSLYFKIVPPIGNVEIRCGFPRELRSKAASAVERTASNFNISNWGHNFKI